MWCFGAMVANGNNSNWVLPVCHPQSKTLHPLSHLIIPITQCGVGGGTRYFLHFGDKQTEAQSGEIICQSPGARNRQKQDLNLGLSTARACAVDSMRYQVGRYFGQKLGDCISLCSSVRMALSMKEEFGRLW